MNVAITRTARIILVLVMLVVDDLVEGVSTKGLIHDPCTAVSTCDLNFEDQVNCTTARRISVDWMMAKDFRKGVQIGAIQTLALHSHAETVDMHADIIVTTSASALCWRRAPNSGDRVPHPIIGWLR